MAVAADERQRMAHALLALAHRRGSAGTFCPSEVARALAEDWRDRMPALREVAGDLVDEGRLVATQRGRVVDPRTARGPIRLGLPRTA